MLIYSANDSCVGLTMKILSKMGVFALVSYVSREKEIIWYL